ncbi:hypothetical protein STEG23_007515, partial [Scotinomys teguina]
RSKGSTQEERTEDYSPRLLLLQSKYLQKDLSMNLQLTDYLCWLAGKSQLLYCFSFPSIGIT